MRKFLTIGLSMLVCASIIISWNASRFIGAKPRPYSKDLDFLPAPLVAKALCLGHRSTIAKLRWIDSFAYFQFQLDRKDDTVTGDGGSSGFVRLYETLIALDPYFLPFYEHAALNVGGILGRHWQSLAFLQQGLINLPHSTELWRNAAAELKVHFNWEESQPKSFDAFLAAWVDAEETEDGKRMVYDWKKSMGGRKFKNLEQLPYWLDRLSTTTRGTPLGDYVEDVIRSQLAIYGQRELSELVSVFRSQKIRRAKFGDISRDLTDPSVKLSEQFQLGGAPNRLEDILLSKVLLTRYHDRVAGFGPIISEMGQLKLRTDPYGYKWCIDGVKVISLGQQHRDFSSRLNSVNGELQTKVKDRGEWPTTLDEIKAWGINLPEVPNGGKFRFEDKWISIDWPKPEAEPWKLR